MTNHGSQEALRSPMPDTGMRVVSSLASRCARWIGGGFPGHRHGGGCRSGLTLIEVLLATVILAVGMTALVTATGRCLAVAAKAKEYETARRLIGQVDLEIPPDFEEIEEGVETGRFGGEFRDYTWRREIIEFEEEEFQMYKVITSVLWSRKGSEAKEEVTTYIYGPTYVRGQANVGE